MKAQMTTTPQSTVSGATLGHRLVIALKTMPSATMALGDIHRDVSRVFQRIRVGRMVGKQRKAETAANGQQAGADGYGFHDDFQQAFGDDTYLADIAQRIQDQQKFVTGFN